MGIGLLFWVIYLVSILFGFWAPSRRLRAVGRLAHVHLHRAARLGGIRGRGSPVKTSDIVSICAIVAALGSAVSAPALEAVFPGHGTYIAGVLALVASRRGKSFACSRIKPAQRRWRYNRRAGVNP